MPVCFSGYSAHDRGGADREQTPKVSVALFGDAAELLLATYLPALPAGAPPLIEVACWSHARRKFYEEYHETASPIARELLERIAALFTIESSISGKSDLAKAIRYGVSRWTALTRYLPDGRLEMSNNAAERAMKPRVPGRKNNLFCGSDAGGQRAACFYTIIETAELNGIDPEAYLTDFISRIDNRPALEIDKLLPWCWQA